MLNLSNFTYNRLLFTVIALLALTPLTARAVVIYPKGGKPRVMGVIKLQDERRIVLTQTLPGGKTRDLVILRDEIDTIVATVDKEMLAKLSPDKPEDYRLYAEELVIKKDDPEAQQAALRLYLIAAWLAPKEHGKSSLLGMTALARSTAEERKFRALAYLLDPSHNPKVLVKPTAAAAKTTGDDGERELLRGLQMLRRGQGRRAEGVFRHPDIPAALDKLGVNLTVSQLISASKAQLSTGMLERVLAVELLLNKAGATSGAPKTVSKSWSQAMQRGDDKPVPVLTLETVTEFDPRQCKFEAGEKFEQGKWVRPPGY